MIGTDRYAISAPRLCFEEEADTYLCLGGWDFNSKMLYLGSDRKKSMAEHGYRGVKAKEEYAKHMNSNCFQYSAAEMEATTEEECTWYEHSSVTSEIVDTTRLIFYWRNAIFVYENDDSLWFVSVSSQEKAFASVRADLPRIFESFTAK